MIRVSELRLELDEDESLLRKKAGKVLRTDPKYIEKLTIFKKSVDARKKDDVHFSYTVDVTLGLDETQVLRRCRSPKAKAAEEYKYTLPVNRRQSAFRPVVVGFGPAGMFAGLILAEAGLRPIVLERGKDIQRRQQDVNAFWQQHILNEESNVQFGEGGAGTFSDGKLTTGIKSPFIRQVLQELYEAGAPEEILYAAKPHIGTDRLAVVVQNIRKKIERLGGEVRLECRLENLILANGFIHGVTYSHLGQTVDMETDAVILAIGHSARDTFETLLSRGIPMEPKPFAMGVRIEHRQEMVNKSQYGAFADRLGAADYKLNVRFPDGTSAYTFCMCPGGHVVAAASGEGGVVTNGMSDFARDGENANAALLVTLTPEDFPEKDVLGGMRWQREIERAAFRAGGANYQAPAQLAGDFLAHRASTTLGSVQPTYRPGVTLCDLHDVLPERITSVLEQAIPALDRKLRGFANPDAVLTAPETRSSSPVRILRGETQQSVGLRGLYPCGEGAGYAGGITSAAVDGLRCAEALLAEIGTE